MSLAGVTPCEALFLLSRKCHFHFFDTHFGMIPNQLDKQTPLCGFDPRCRQYTTP